MKFWVLPLSYWIVAILLAFAAFIIFAMSGGIGYTGDYVYFEKGDRTESVGVLLDGKVGGADVNDKSYTSVPDDPLQPGEVDAGAHNELIAFHRGYQPALKETVPWTSGRDDIIVEVKAALEVPLQVWLVGTDRTDLKARAVMAVAATDAMWVTERVGLRIGTATYTESPTTGLGSVTDFTCATDGCSDASSLRSKAGFTADMINVYYVDTVNSGEGASTGNGVWTGGFTLVLGSGTLSDLLGHEIGHALYLNHVDDNASFTMKNVMHSASDTRKYLSEGQIFRAHMEPCSVLNDGTDETGCYDDPGGAYGLRPGMPMRTCGDLVIPSNTTCPMLETWIWTEAP